MTRFNGGTKVPGGYYFNTSSWEFVTITGDRGLLPGDAKATYLHTPLLALFVVAPVLGLAFAMFLPFIGLALPLYALGRAALGTGKKLVQSELAALQAEIAARREQER